MLMAKNCYALIVVRDIYNMLYYILLLAKIVLWVIVHTQMHAGVVQKKILKLAVHGYEKDTSEN